MQNLGYLGYLNYKTWLLKMQMNYSKLNVTPRRKKNIYFNYP